MKHILHHNHHSIDMCHGPLFSKIIKFSIPVMLTGVLQLLFNAADLIVVGQFCGDTAIAAVGSTASLINLIIGLFIGISTGTAVAVSHAIGAEDEKEVSDTVHTAIPLAFISGLFLSAVGMIFSRDILSLMNVPDEILPLSSLYMEIYFAGMVFNMVYNFGASILRASGDSKSPLIFLTISGVINVALNVLFVTAFHMSVDGVAIATTVSQAISAILVVIELTRKDDACKLHLRKMKIKLEPLKKMLSVGIPTGIQSSMFSFSNVIIQSSINSFGPDVIAGNSAAINIENFVYIMCNSISQAALNFTGQNFGAKNVNRVKKTYIYCISSVLLFSTVLASLVMIFGKKLLTFYLPDSSDAVDVGYIRIICIMSLYFFAGLMDVTTCSIRGMGRSLVTTIITILGVCGLRVLWIATIFQIERFHTIESIYISYPITWFISFSVQFVAFIIFYKIFKKQTLREKSTV